MAFMSQDKKKELAPVIKQVLKKYKLTGSLSIRNHSALVLTITGGPIDFIKNAQEVYKDRYNEELAFNYDYADVNVHWAHEQYSGIAKEALEELIAALNVGNWDKSDIYTDYFDVGWYIGIQIGKYDKAYQLAA